MVMMLEDVIEEHAEEAAFLWQQRDMAVRAPDFDLSDLMEWDERLEAHLDGLRIAGEAGWRIGKEVGWDLPGEYFTAMAQAIDQGKPAWMKEVMDAAEGEAGATRGVIAALGWAGTGKLQGLVKKLLETRNPYGRQLGIAACAVHRVHPGEALFKAFESSHAGEKARALKAAGELGLSDRVKDLEQHLENEDEEVRFWAAWSAGLFGSAPAQRILGLFASAEGPRRRQSLDLLVRLLPAEKAQDWLRQHLRGREHLRWALIGAGIQGDPFYLEPLFKQFSDEEVARVAGEAFEMITGLNIFELSLEVLEDVPAPTEEETAESLDALEDEEDDIRELGEDTGLVVPDPEKMRPWLDENAHRFAPGQRLLCGEPISPEHCDKVLRSGRQRQRRAAALETALASKGSPLFETRAPGRRQQAALGQGAP